VPFRPLDALPLDRRVGGGNEYQGRDQPLHAVAFAAMDENLELDGPVK
jgi:hypothetical protein